MNVPEPVRSRTIIELPPAAGRPFEVYVNGVAQREGTDFRLVGRRLVFERQLRQEGKLGFWRWLSMLLGVAGTYRQNDAVDVVFERSGRRIVERGVALEPES